jgi:hypothetical protein
MRGVREAPSISAVQNLAMLPPMFTIDRYPCRRPLQSIARSHAFQTQVLRLNLPAPAPTASVTSLGRHRAKSVAYPQKGTGGRVPQNLVRRGRPCICPPRFHSMIVVGIPLARYRGIEYSATFDDTRPLYRRHAVQNYT